MPRVTFRHPLDPDGTVGPVAVAVPKGSLGLTGRAPTRVIGLGPLAIAVPRGLVSSTGRAPIAQQSGASSFDASEYRTATYGAPTHYCDPARSLGSSGSGTLGDPWNLNQAAANAVAGNRVGILPGVGVDMTTTSNDNIPAFNPTNEGTSNGNRIIYVTKYAAIALASVETNSNRSEFRHSGGPPTIVGGIGAGNGCAMLGSNSRDYITYDGFYFNQAEAWMKEDSGNLRTELCTGVTFTNFVIKGANHTVASNPIIYRPQQSTNTILSNFRVYDFDNDGTGSNTPQPALFSDQYGDQNYLIEHGEIINTEVGPFPKGTATGVFNYGVMRFNIIRNLSACFRFNDFDGTNFTEIHHNLCHTFGGVAGIGSRGLALSSETSDPRNVLIHHNTFANGLGTDINFNGVIYIKEAATMINVTLRDNICDFLNTGFGHAVDAGELAGPIPTMNYNGYYKAGATPTWSYNGQESSSIGAWRSLTSQEANSRVLASDPFVNRGANNYTIVGGHEARTASSTGGQIGAYEGVIIPGPFGSY